VCAVCTCTLQAASTSVHSRAWEGPQRARRCARPADAPRARARSYRPHPRLARALDIMFTLHAEHEMNCSTAAARHLASSGVDVYTAVAGARVRVACPLHPARPRAPPAAPALCGRALWPPPPLGERRVV